MYSTSQNELLVPLLYERQAFYNKPKSSDSDIRKSFNNLVKQLADLYKEGTISEKTLNILLKQITSAYMESEITERVERAFRPNHFRSKHLWGLF